jgi:hypothetical protein
MPVRRPCGPRPDAAPMPPRRRRAGRQGCHQLVRCFALSAWPDDSGPMPGPPSADQWRAMALLRFHCPVCEAACHVTDPATVASRERCEQCGPPFMPRAAAPAGRAPPRDMPAVQPWACVARGQCGRGPATPARPARALGVGSSTPVSGVATRSVQNRTPRVNPVRTRREPCPFHMPVAFGRDFETGF